MKAKKITDPLDQEGGARPEETKRKEGKKTPNGYSSVDIPGVPVPYFLFLLLVA